MREPDCLNCNNAGPAPRQVPELPPELAVIAEPAQLMFYGNLADAVEVPTQTVTVRNATARPVYVTRALVVDDVQSLAGYGAASYFSVDGADEEVLLLPGQKVVLTVAFAPSAQQREAVLVIQTSDETDDQLFVDLSGKYFGGPTTLGF